MKKETETTPINTNKGATCSPLLGDSGKPGSQEIPSTAPGPGVEVCGRPWERRYVKRTKKVVERWPPVTVGSPKGPFQGKPVKRLRETTSGEAKRPEIGQRSMQDFLRIWSKEKEQEEEGNSTQPKP